MSLEGKLGFDRVRGLVHNRCHQVYGRLSGTVELDDGEVVRIEDIPFFCEHAVNRW